MRLTIISVAKGRFFNDFLQIYNSRNSFNTRVYDYLPLCLRRYQKRENVFAIVLNETVTRHHQ